MRIDKDWLDRESKRETARYVMWRLNHARFHFHGHHLTKVTRMTARLCRWFVTKMSYHFRHLYHMNVDFKIKAALYFWHYTVKNTKTTFSCSISYVLYLFGPRNIKYLYIGHVGFEWHLYTMPSVLHMFYVTAGKNYSYVRSWKAIQRFWRDKPDLGLTYSVLDHNYICIV